MSTKTVRQEVIWAVLAMESAIALPIMAIIASGEGAQRVGMLVLLVLLLPAGFVCVRRFTALRDPAWRVLTGFALVVGIRLSAPLAPGDGPAAALGRFMQALIPASIAFAAWWRGGSFGDAELTAADLQIEFLLGGCGLLLMLLVFHGLVAVEAQVLVFSAGLFAASGLIALVLARQDAAEASAQRGARVLGGLVALLPIAVSVALLIVLNPDLMAAGWLALAHGIEFVLMPLLLLLSWLASLLPVAGTPGAPRPPPQLFQPPPNIDALARQQAPPEWIPWLALTLVLVMVLFMAAGILRMLLETEVVMPPSASRAEDSSVLTAERSGGAGQDARQLLRWLASLLRRRFAPSRTASAAQRLLQVEDAWTAYRALLDWAASQGIRRQPAETTRQLQARLVAFQPDAIDVVGAVTATYEDERYGSHQPAQDLLQRIRNAVSRLRQ
jgi:hypothetical protein